VLYPDGETLIVSSPETAELIAIDTSHDKEIKRVKVSFRPTALALRGPSLYAVGKGSSLLYVLDAQTGQAKKEIRVPGATLAQLACHPTSGPLFAAKDRYEILAVDTETGKVEKTEAEGNFLAVDLKGEFLYTGTQKPMKDILVLSRGPRKSVRVGVAKTNVNSSVVKYSLKYHPESGAPRGRSSSRAGSRRAQPAAGPDHEGRLYLIPLELTDDQKAELAKSFPASKG